jgi:putative oxidoreductase
MKKNIIRTTNYPGLIIRLIVGLIFLSEGIQKFLYPELLGSGRFEKLGIRPSVFWSDFTASFEICCAVLVILGWLTRLAVIPLVLIMIVAFEATKLPELINTGFWALAHDGRTDFAMTMLLIFLFINGSGKYSVDFNNYAAKKTNL